jgi:hypothetical protein
MGARYARAANGVMPGKLPLATRRVLVAIALRVLDTGRPIERVTASAPGKRAVYTLLISVDNLPP